MNPESEYIRRVDFPGLFTNTSDRPSSGYTDYGASLGLFTMERGATYPFELTQEYVSQAYDDAWRIWIDLDHNGQFTSNEIVYTSPGASREPVQGELQIPADARTGLTRMRIMLRFLTASNACPFGDSNFGEVEDYCVEIVPSSVCPPPAAIMVGERTESTVNLSWTAVGPAVSYQADFRAQDEVDWESAGTVTEEAITLGGLDTCTSYVVRIRSLCAEVESEGYQRAEFSSACVSRTSDLAGTTAAWMVYPNPVGAQLQLASRAATMPEEVEVRVYNSLGQCVAVQSWQSSRELSLSTVDWQAGLYTVTLWQHGLLWSSQKVIK
jgi:hypothetical protein